MPQHKGVTSSTLESKSTYPEPRYFGREKSRTTSDKIFSGTVIVSALSSLLILTGILVYLSANSLPIIIDQGFSFITGSDWSNIEGEESFQIWPMLYGSLFNAIIGLVIAVPISVLLALFIVFLAPKALSKTLIVVIDV